MMYLRCRWVCCAALLLMAFVATAEDGAPAPGALKLSVSGGAVTIESNGASLGEVLNALSAETGLSAELPAGLAASPLSLVLREVPLDAALRRILRGTSFLFLYEPAQGGAHAGQQRMTGVRVLVTGSRLQGGDSNTYVRFESTPSTSEAVTNAFVESMHAGSDDARDKAVGRLVSAAQAGDDPKRRVQALEGLVEWSEDDKARQAIVQALKDPDGRVRRTAITLVGSMNSDVELLDALATAALNDDDPGIRQLSLETLVMGYPPEEVLGFVKRATVDPDAGVRTRAEMLLQGMGSGG